jgi:hypothetical protein
MMIETNKGENMKRIVTHHAPVQVLDTTVLYLGTDKPENLTLGSETVWMVATTTSDEDGGNLDHHNELLVADNETGDFFSPNIIVEFISFVPKGIPVEKLAERYNQPILHAIEKAGYSKPTSAAHQQ